LELFPILITCFELYLLFTVFVLLLDNREPAETFSWIFVFILFPGFGFFLYLMTGRNWTKTYDKKRKLPQFVAKQLVSIFKPLNDGQEETIKLMKSRTSVYQDDLMTLLYRNSNAILTLDNDVVIFHEGKSKYESLIKDIKAAKKFIHIEYFIWYSNDSWGRELQKLLSEKVKEGVEVKILYDYSGCFFTLSRGYVRDMRKAGIQMYPFFNYLSPFKMHTLNYRNHRKIVVIDGTIGYTGGMNIGEEYATGGKKYKSWRDSHVRVEGECVAVLQAIFAIDWFNTTSQEEIFDPKYYLIGKDVKSERFLPIQFPTSGYDSTWPSILHLYFGLITMAQKNIYISSPYFIPDQSLLMALKTAAMRGKDVRIMMTGVPDNPVPYWAAFSYFEDLLKAGVKIFQYEAGFMHAKVFSIDSRICSVGSANFDIRSLRLNYEINAVMYDEKATKEVDAQFIEDLTHCREVTLAQLNQASIPVRLRNSLLRLISPIL
jgi:cardiolipin synthase